MPDQEIPEDNLSFLFPPDWVAVKFDKPDGFAGGAHLAHLRKMDILALGDGTLWLIEAKDYRTDPRTHAKRHRGKDKPPLEEEFVGKLRDSITILVAARGRGEGRLGVRGTGKCRPQVGTFRYWYQ